MAIAAAVYHLAMRDEMLPRFTKEQMPASPAPTRPVPAAADDESRRDRGSAAFRDISRISDILPISA